MALDKCPVCNGKGTIWAMSKDYYGIECWKCLGIGSTNMSIYKRETSLPGQDREVVGNDNLD